MEKRILVLGIGNLLMGDEGVGVHFARMMEGETLPPGVDVLDGGTGGFHLMEYLESYPEVILVDATLDGLMPGTISMLQPRFSKDFPRALSTHDIGLKDLLDGLTFLGRMPHITLFAVSIEKIQPQRIDLTAEIQCVLPSLVMRVKHLVDDILEKESAEKTEVVS
jgi:hydrogenase maturation protease